MKFDKRSFHIIKRKEHKTKIDNLLKQELDGAFDEDIVSFLVFLFKFSQISSFKSVVNLNDFQNSPGL